MICRGVGFLGGLSIVSATGLRTNEGGHDSVAFRRGIGMCPLHELSVMSASGLHAKKGGLDSVASKRAVWLPC